jgi:glycosyltransferase involved in cell wall biosynthesis
MVNSANSFSKKEIFYVVADMWACGWYRCNTPGVELNKRGHHVMLHGEFDLEAIPFLDVIIFQRQCQDTAIEAIDRANQFGATTVYELDDDLWNIDPTNPAYEFWNQPGMLQSLVECVRKVKVVTTTTPRLAQVLSRFNKNVYVLPNMLPQEYWQVEQVDQKRKDTLVIGWAGSQHHWIDLKILEGIIEQILDEYPFVEFHIAGAKEMPFKPHDRLIKIEPVGLEDYAEILSGFNIALAPLTDSHFNKCKSDLKFVEYGMVGSAVVASKVEAYTNTIIHGENGFLARNAKDWLKYIKRLVEDEKLRSTVSANAKKYAETRTIEKNIGLWEKAYGLK